MQNQKVPRSSTSPPPQGVPPDSVLVCTYLLDVGMACIDEEAWFVRSSGVDTLWVWNEYQKGSPSSAPSADEPDVASRRLLDRAIRGAWAFQFPKHVVRPGLLSEGDLKEILASIKADLERQAEEALCRESDIVRVARELGVGPEPTGTGPVHWQARCPGTNHPLYIQAATGTFGCGWCKRKGGEAELRAFVAERRAKAKA